MNKGRSQNPDLQHVWPACQLSECVSCARLYECGPPCQNDNGCLGEPVETPHEAALLHNLPKGRTCLWLQASLPNVTGLGQNGWRQCISVDVSHMDVSTAVSCRCICASTLRARTCGLICLGRSRALVHALMR